MFIFLGPVLTLENGRLRVSLPIADSVEQQNDASNDGRSLTSRAHRGVNQLSGVAYPDAHCSILFPIPVEPLKASKYDV